MLYAALRMAIYLAFAALYLVWGSTYLAIAVALDHGLPPLSAAALRMTIAGGLIVAWMLATRRPLPAARRWPALAIAGVLLFLGGNGLVMVAEEQLPSGIVAVLTATMPLWLTAIEWLLPKGERPMLAVLLGLLLGFVGVLILVGPEVHGAARIAAVIGCLFAPLLWALGSVWSKYRLVGIGLAGTSAFEMLFGAVALAVAALLRGEPQAFHPDAKALWALAYLVVAGSLVGFGSFVYLLGRVPAARVATYAYVNPVVALLLGWWLHREPLGVRHIAGTLIVLASVLLVARLQRLGSR